MSFLSMLSFHALLYVSLAVCRFLALSQTVDAVVCVGCLIKVRFANTRRVSVAGDMALHHDYLVPFLGFG